MIQPESETPEKMNTLGMSKMYEETSTLGRVLIDQIPVCGFYTRHDDLMNTISDNRGRIVASIGERTEENQAITQYERAIENRFGDDGSLSVLDVLSTVENVAFFFLGGPFEATLIGGAIIGTTLMHLPPTTEMLMTWITAHLLWHGAHGLKHQLDIQKVNQIAADVLKPKA